MTVFAGRLYVTWSEFNGTCNNIRVATLSLGTMRWISVPRIGFVNASYMTSFGPRFATVNTEEGTLLQLFWYSFDGVRAVATLHVGTIYPQYWKETTVVYDRHGVPGMDPAAATCPFGTYIASTASTHQGATQIQVAAVDRHTGALIVKTPSLNHHPRYDASNVDIGCNAAGIAIAWVEFDGISYKVRLTSQTAMSSSTAWIESAWGRPTLTLSNHIVAVGTDRSGSCTTTGLNFRLVVASNTPYIPTLNALSLSTERTVIVECDTTVKANLVLPSASDRRELSVAHQITIDTSLVTVL
jgi:hypothetical protein